MERGQADEWGATLDAYRLRLQDERMPTAERRALQDGANPAYIPRNALMQDAIAAAEVGSFDEVCRPVPCQARVSCSCKQCRRQGIMAWLCATSWLGLMQHHGLAAPTHAGLCHAASVCLLCCVDIISLTEQAMRGRIRCRCAKQPCLNFACQFAALPESSTGWRVCHQCMFREQLWWCVPWRSSMSS